MHISSSQAVCEADQHSCLTSKISNNLSHSNPYFSSKVLPIPPEGNTEHTPMWSRWGHLMTTPGFPLFWPSKQACSECISCININNVPENITKQQGLACGTINSRPLIAFLEPLSHAAHWPLEMRNHWKSADGNFVWPSVQSFKGDRPASRPLLTRSMWLSCRESLTFHLDTKYSPERIEAAVTTTPDWSS